MCYRRKNVEIRWSSKHQPLKKGMYEAMPLTNVWTRSIDGEWVRTTAREMDQMYSYTVPADSHHFRCYSCHQYVTFVKGEDKVSHFKHSRGYNDKDCEDRGFNAGVNSCTLGRNIVEMPMRLTLDGSKVCVDIGFLPINQSELARCISVNATICISPSNGQSTVYCVDESRFIPNATTWLPIPQLSMSGMSIVITPTTIKPKVWSSIVTPIPSYGAIFDSSSEHRVTDKGDVSVGKKYYLLVKRGKRIYSSSEDIELVKLPINDVLWDVYYIKALRFSDTASDFFFNNLRLRLTNHPVELSVIWPPVLEMDDVIETNYRNIMVVAKGEGDIAVYPEYNSSVASKKIHGDTKIINIRSTGPLQMVMSERYSHTLKNIYIRSIDRTFYDVSPTLEVYSDDKKPCVDTLLSKIPPGGILHFAPSDDGYIDVYEDEDFSYRKCISAGKLTRITEIKKNTRICIFLGFELLREILIAPQPAKSAMLQVNHMPNWHGRIRPFPQRYAWILGYLNKESELYQRVYRALQRGEIPQDGWHALQMLLEDC